MILCCEDTGFRNERSVVSVMSGTGHSGEGVVDPSGESDRPLKFAMCPRCEQPVAVPLTSSAR